MKELDSNAVDRGAELLSLYTGQYNTDSAHHIFLRVGDYSILSTIVETSFDVAD